MRSDLERRVGHRIAKVRRWRDMTQAELAEAIGFRRVTVALMETGKHAISLATIERIASVLDMPVAWFFLDNNEVPNDRP